MTTADPISVARHLEDLGVEIVRGGFASWIRQDLGFQASDEHVDRVMARVQTIVAAGQTTTVHDLTASIAAELPAASHIDAFGGSTWRMD